MVRAGAARPSGLDAWTRSSSGWPLAAGHFFLFLAQI